MADDCPDVIGNLEDAIESVEDAYFNSQVDAMKNIGEDMARASEGSISDVPADDIETVCAAAGGATDAFNNLKNSCEFDPTGCLRQVLDSGVLGGNPLLAGAALAAATFVDAATGNFTPPLQVPPPSLSVGIQEPSLPGGEIDLPDIPAPPPSDECQDPISDLNEALKSAEETYAELHKQAAKGLADTIDEFTGGLGGLPTDIQANAFCVGAGAGFDAAASLALGTCQIDVGECLKQVLQSGVLGGGALGGVAAGAALFADGASGNLPSFG